MARAVLPGSSAVRNSETKNGDHAMKRLLVLRAILVLVCVSHLVLGGIAYVSVSARVTKTIAAFYGASVTVTPQLQHVVRILGAFMIAIGVLSVFALYNPYKNRAIIDGIIVLLLLRVSQRMIFGNEVHRAFGVSYQHLWTQTVFFFTLALVLFLLRPKADVPATA
jgi:hypothetical protein